MLWFIFINDRLNSFGHSKHVSSFNASSLCTRRWIYSYKKVSFHHVNIILTILIMEHSTIPVFCFQFFLPDLFFGYVSVSCVIISCCITIAESFLRLQVFKELISISLMDFRLTTSTSFNQGIYLQRLISLKFIIKIVNKGVWALDMKGL